MTRKPLKPPLIRITADQVDDRMIIKFYLRLGCTVSPSPDPELFQLEPEDIHLDFQFS